MSALSEHGIVPRHDRIGTQRLACPECDRGPRDAALAVTIKDDRIALWLCHRCGFKGAVRGGRESFARPPQTQIVKRAEPERYDTLAPHWRVFWDDCGRITPETIGARYLESRNCALPPIDGDLRQHAECWHSPSQQRLPALVALITDVVTRAPLSLHFTFLKRDGSGKADVEQQRLLLPKHRKAGGVIRLWPDDAVTYSIGLAEGIESALSLAHAHTPVWATIDAGNLSTLQALHGIESVIIAVDHDDAGLKAAHAFAVRWTNSGKDVRLVMPIDLGQDLNDVAQVAA